jgi:hypothetical protein
MDFLVDTTALGPDGPEIAANRDGAAGIAVRAARDLLMDPHRRELRTLGYQGVDLGLVWVQATQAARDPARGGLIQLERRGHEVSRASQ